MIALFLKLGVTGYARNWYEPLGIAVVAIYRDSRVWSAWPRPTVQAALFCEVTEVVLNQLAGVILVFLGRFSILRCRPSQFRNLIFLDTYADSADGSTKHREKESRVSVSNVVPGETKDFLRVKRNKDTRERRQP